MIEPPATSLIDFWVDGRPSPGGSKRAFVYHPRSGSAPYKCPRCKAPIGVALSDMGGDNVKAWRSAVRAAGVEAWKVRPLDEPLRVWFYFELIRPMNHFVSGNRDRPLKASAPENHRVRPDTTKLQRSTEDALTGVLWTDDSIIVDGPLSFKRYSDRQGVRVIVELVEPKQRSLIE